jgi:MFS family permease
MTVLAVFIGYSGVLPVFRSSLMNYLGIGETLFGLMFSAGSLSGIISVISAGRLIDLWGPRRIIRICLAGIGSAMLIIAFAGPRYLLFAAAAALTGIFSFPLAIAINAYLAKLFPRHKRRVLSLNLASSSVGGIMFPLAAEGLLGLAKNYESISFARVLHAPFFLAGLILIGSSFIYRGRLAYGPRPKRNKISLNFISGEGLLTSPREFMLVCLMALHGTADASLHIWMPRFLESGSFPAQGILPGFVMSGYALSYVLSRLTMFSIPERFGRRVFLSAPGIAGGACMAAGILSRNYLLTAAGYVLGAFFWSFEYPAMMGVLIEKSKKKFGTNMAFSFLIGGISTFIMINLIGVLSRRAGEEMMWRIMLIPAIGFILAGIGGALWLRLFEPRTGKSF